MKVLITGADGFLGKNLLLHLGERKEVQVVSFTRGQREDQLAALLQGVDCVFHLAGVNRPKESAEFTVGNVDFTRSLCDALAAEALITGRRVPVVFTSSIQAVFDSPYGNSKRAAEDALFALQREYGVPVHIFRLPNVFGKWSRPYYNSVVATFCYEVARDLPITVKDPDRPLTLVYVDDVITRFIQIIDGSETDSNTNSFATLGPLYETTVGELALKVKSFKTSRATLMTEPVGKDFLRVLYATYVSYLPVEKFSYPVPMHGDSRGVFVEMLKTPDTGQISYFSAFPGITRGGHYHHTKTEKFLVIKGQAQFRFRHMHTGETFQLMTTGGMAEIVETVPGWTHDITNIGSEEMLVLLWANEIFDRTRPDTFKCTLENGNF